jgi:hypothetical protein
MERRVVSDALIPPVASFLADQLGDVLVAAFIYGSVAAGRIRPGSDIDCFVLTGRELSQHERHEVSVRFAELQRQLGFTPDAGYPIELFSAAACEALLGDPSLDTAMRDAAATGTIGQLLAESDTVEVLRALLDRRLVLRPARELDQLTERAQAILNHQPADAVRLKQALHITEDVR